MLPNTKALLAFAGRFLLIFFLILPLWFVITPGYNRLLASGANILLAFTEDPHVHRLVGWKDVILIVRSDSPLKEGMEIQGFTGYLTHFNLVLMTGLVLAQRQVAWRRRCASLAVALGVLFITHILYLVIGVKFFEQSDLEAFQSAAGRVYVWGTNFYLSMASQLLPILIGLFLYRFVAQSHDQGLLLGPERRVDRIEEAEARIKGTGGAKGQERRRADKGKR